MSNADHFRYANRALALLLAILVLWVVFGESSLPGGVQ